MAAPTINGTIGTATSPEFGDANVTLSKPSGTATGEVLAAYVTALGGTAIAEPAGWTAVYEVATGDAKSGLYYLVIVGGEPSSWTWTVTSGNDRTTGVIFRIGGADAATPLNASNYSSQSGDSAADTSPSVTTTVADCLVLVAYHYGSEPTIHTIPSGTSEVVNFSRSGALAALRVATPDTPPGAGSTGTYLWTLSGFAGDAILSTAAFAPSGGSPPAALPPQPFTVRQAVRRASTY